MLLADGTSLSAGTVQNVLNARRLGTRAERCLLLQRDPTRSLAAEQEAAVSQHNPRWRERHERGRAPGVRLVAGAAPLCRLNGVGRVLLLAVVDTYSSYAFARLSTARSAEPDPIGILCAELLPFFARVRIRPDVVALDSSVVLRFRPGVAGNGPASMGSLDLAAADPAASARNGWIRHLRDLLVLQLLRPSTDGGEPPSLEALRTALAEWLRSYNHDRAQAGFPCYGSTPWALIQAWQRRRRRRQGRS